MKPGTLIKEFMTKKGKSALIRVVKRSDLDDLLAYANDLVREDTFVMLSGKKMTYEEERKYLNDSIKKVKNGEKIHLVVEVNGVFAGSCEIRIHDKRQKHVGDIGISLGRTFREEGIGGVCIETLIEEAKKAGLKLLYLHCFEMNARARHVYERAGFHLAGIIPMMYEYKGQFVGEATYYLPL